MLMVLENDMMNLIDPLGQTLLHSQPIGSIRVWGVGRDNGRSVFCLSSRRLVHHMKYEVICFSNTVQERVAVDRVTAGGPCSLRLILVDCSTLQKLLHTSDYTLQMQKIFVLLSLWL